jgi:hypothetical protein
MVFADRCRSLVREVFAGAGDAGVNLLDAAPGPLLSCCSIDSSRRSFAFATLRSG